MKLVLQFKLREVTLTFDNANYESKLTLTLYKIHPIIILSEKWSKRNFDFKFIFRRLTLKVHHVRFHFKAESGYSPHVRRK